MVHTEGNRKARLMFVGEAPGADEDAQARPFVGRAGQLLTKIIEAIGLKREEVLIGNVNRCRPPGNRAPTAEEASMCKPYPAARNRCGPTRSDRGARQHRDEKPARHARGHHASAWNVPGLPGHQGDADISPGVSSARPFQKTRDMGRLEESQGLSG